MPKTKLAHRATVSSMTFARTQENLDTPVVEFTADGSAIFNAVPYVANQDLDYFAYELPTDELFGLAVTYEYDVAQTNIPAGLIAWNTPLVGRLTDAAGTGMLDQFEGLPLTDGHCFVEFGRRDEVAVGTFLCDAVFDNNLARTRALLSSAVPLLRVTAQGSELSIGGDGVLETNANRGGQGEPDFFIVSITLNHCALVEEGRAGPQARLLNHKATLANNQPKKETQSMKTIIIAGVAHEVPDAVADEFARMNTAASETVSQTTTLQNTIATLTTERDTAQGQLDVAQTALTAASEQVTTLQNAKPDIAGEAARLAAEHVTFVAEAGALGHTGDIAIGEEVGVMVALLNARGATCTAETARETLNGIWAFALKNASAKPHSVVDVPSKPGSVNVSSQARAHASVANSYFTPKKKEAK